MSTLLCTHLYKDEKGHDNKGFVINVFIRILFPLALGVCLSAILTHHADNVLVPGVFPMTYYYYYYKIEAA